MRWLFSRPCGKGFRLPRLSGAGQFAAPPLPHRVVGRGSVVASSGKVTRVLTVDPERPDPAAIREAAAIIRAGGLVAFPTETVYGLGADATNADAVTRVFAAKGRPADNPLIVHVARPADVIALVTAIPLHARELMERFWPGPLTLALPRTDRVPGVVTAGLSTVGVRMPAHPVALHLIEAAGVPIAAPSANLSGRPSPTTAQHVLEDLSGRIDMVLDGGETGVGVESTFVDLSTDPPVLCRPGGVSVKDICAVLGPVNIDPTVIGSDGDLQVRSPGQRHPHYAPRAGLILVEGQSVLRVQEVIANLAHELTGDGKRVGILAAAESRGAYQAAVVLEVGSRRNLPMVAATLFGTLRAFDHHDIDVIVAESFPEEGIGLAIMNRLRKAAAGHIVKA